MKKKILVVGGTSGIGEKISELFINKKYNLSILGRKINPKFKNTTNFYKTDILNKKSFNQTLKKIKKKKFDIIVNCIGGSLGIKNSNSSMNNYLKTWQYNLGYAIEINNLFLDNMKKNKWGRIVHISSATSFNLTGGGPYSSAKSALNVYVKALAEEYGKYNVIISAICPGPVRVNKKFLTKQESKKTKFWKNFSSNHLPMGRLARIDEVLPVIDLLASENASFCSGAIWNMDGMQK